MTIYRGVGGGGDATTDAGLSQLTLLEQSAVNSATNAASSASAASSSASAAASSASSASTSATNAAASEAAVASLYDSFDDRYLGPKASDPALDNDGNALLTGALYFNTVSNVIRVYNGTAWSDIVLDASAFVQTTDIGVTVQAFDATLLNAADIGVSVQAYDATLLNVADIGVSVQAFDADTAKTDVAQTFTASQRGTVTTDNDLSFDLAVTNNFSCTPAGTGTLTFTNITAGQSGFILLDNSGGHAISAAATTKVGASTLGQISVAGVYLLSYFSNGTNVYVVNSGALA